MIDVIISVSAFFLVSRIARSKGLKGPVPGILGAMSLPLGILVGAILVVKVTGYYPYTIEGSYLPLIFQDEAYAIPVLTGLLFLGAIILYYALLPKRPYPAQPKRTSHFPFRLLGIILVIFGAFILFNFGSSYIWSFLGFCMFGLASQSFSLAKRNRSQSASQRLAADGRAPVLWLRSFVSETKLSSSQIFDRSVSFIPWSREQNWEELLFEPFSTGIGPVIALGNPGDYLPPVGAARSYPDGLTWFEEFASYARRASCILVTPGSTVGLIRELQWIRYNIEARRVFILIPTVTADDWNEFVKIMSTKGFTLPVQLLPEWSILGFTDDWSYRLVGTYLADPLEYVDAIRYGLHHENALEFVGSTKERDEKDRASKAYALGWWLAATYEKISSTIRGKKHRSDLE